MAKKLQAEAQPQGQTQPDSTAPALKPNWTFWKLLILPSMLILGITIALYYLRPMRDAFIRGEAIGSYLLFGTYAAYSPKFWMIGLSAILFVIWFILALGRTVRHREWGYWQRLLGLIALTASAALLFITGLPEIGMDARDAGWTSLNGHYYHLLVQKFPGPNSGTILRFSVFNCDQGAVTCQRVQAEDKTFQSGDRVPALELLLIEADGQVIVTRANSPEYITLYRPQ